MEAGAKKICFVGAPSTGKSTLAKYLAEELIKNNYSTELVGEFARDYIIEHGTIEGPQAQFAIAVGQKEREKTAQSRNPDFIVCDVPIFLSQIYFDFLKDKIFGTEAIKLNEAEKEIQREIGSAINSYDFVFFLPLEIQIQEDGTRLYTKDVKEISERIKKFLNLHNIKYYELSGTIEERVGKAKTILNL